MNLWMVLAHTQAQSTIYSPKVKSTANAGDIYKIVTCEPPSTPPTVGQTGMNKIKRNQKKNKNSKLICMPFTGAGGQKGYTIGGEVSMLRKDFSFPSPHIFI